MSKEDFVEDALELAQKHLMLNPDNNFSEGEEVIILGSDGKSDIPGKVVSVSGTAHVGFVYEVVYESRKMCNEVELSKKD